MRVVVMDEDMHEPITVVEIPAWLMREVEQGKRRDICLATPLNMESWFTMADQIPNVPESLTISHVRLRMEPIYKGGRRPGGDPVILHWLAVPDNPELALLLRAAFLPGQMTELRRREMQSWFQGACAGAVLGR